MLPYVNLLYLSASVLIIMDSSYFSSFWTLFEAWLAYQQVTRDGLRPAPVWEQRCTVACIYNARPQYDGNKLHRVWRNRTPKDAHDVLAKPDIQVTNGRDMEVQLKKLLELDHNAQEYQLATATSVERDMLTASGEQTQFASFWGTVVAALVGAGDAPREDSYTAIEA